MSGRAWVSLLWEPQTVGLIADVQGIGSFVIASHGDSPTYRLLLNGKLIETAESIEELKQAASHEVWRRMIEP